MIGKETERGWEQADDISTLLPSLIRYQRNTGTAPNCWADEIDDKRLVGLRGVVKISHLVPNGTALLNLDAFAAASQCLTLTVPEADTL